MHPARRAVTIADAMALRVFLSYSLNPEEGALPWRLQTLATAYGVGMYVPRRKTYQLSQARYSAADKEDRAAMDRSDCVLAIITADDAQARGAIRDELGRAAGRKLIVPVVQEGYEGLPILKDLREKASVPAFVFSLQDGAGKVESAVVRYLKAQRLIKLSKEDKQAIAALVEVVMGLLSLTSLAQT